MRCNPLADERGDAGGVAETTALQKVDVRDHRSDIFDLDKRCLRCAFSAAFGLREGQKAGFSNSICASQFIAIRLPGDRPRAAVSPRKRYGEPMLDVSHVRFTFACDT